MTRLLVRRVLSTILAAVISMAVLWWLLADGAGTALIDALHRARLWPLLLGALIAIAIQAIRAWRFALLATGALARPSWTMIGIATKLVLFNFLLPFKLGELSFPLMMKRAYGTPFGQGAGILILCRLMDFGVVVAILLLSAAWLLDPAVLGWDPGLLALLGLAALATPLLVAGQLPRMLRLTAPWPRLEALAAQMSHGAAMMHPPRQRMLTILLTCAIWIAHAAIAWLVAMAIGAGFDVPPMAMASAASNLAFALPISGVAGLGPPQAAWATMLHLAGHDWTPAISSALLCHGLLLVSLTVFGLAFWAGQAGKAAGATGAGRADGDRDDHGSAPSPGHR